MSGPGGALAYADEQVTAVAELRTSAPESFVLAREAQEVGLVVTCLRPHRNQPGGAMYEAALWEPDGALWARVNYAAPELIRTIIDQYAERQVRAAGGTATLRCAALAGCPAVASVVNGRLGAIEGWTFSTETGWRCPAHAIEWRRP